MVSNSIGWNWIKIAILKHLCFNVPVCLHCNCSRLSAWVPRCHGDGYNPMLKFDKCWITPRVSLNVYLEFFFVCFAKQGFCNIACRLLHIKNMPWNPINTENLPVLTVGITINDVGLKAHFYALNDPFSPADTFFWLVFWPFCVLISSLWFVLDQILLNQAHIYRNVK